MTKKESKSAEGAERKGGKGNEKNKFESLLKRYGFVVMNNGGSKYFCRKDGSQKVPYSTTEPNDISNQEAKSILKNLGFPQNTINDILR